MNLKHISYLILVLFVALSYTSCNSDSDSGANYAATSSDAQIYSFKLSGKAKSSADTLEHSLANTKFAIDQLNQIIYNPDSLAYGLIVRNFSTSVGFSTATPSGASLILTDLSGQDSTVVWNTTDSVNFSILRGIVVTAQNGTTKKNYRIDLRVHKIDPDTIVWKQQTSLSNGATLQKTILFKDNFYCYSTKGGVLSLNVLDKSGSTWAAKTLTSPPAAILLESITIYNGILYATNANGNSFRSADGIAWSDSGNKNLLSILGVLPGKAQTDDLLLVVVKDGSNHYVASTKDMNTFAKVADISSLQKEKQFPASEFAAVTNIDRSNSQYNMLVLTGGKDFNGQYSNVSWYFIADGNKVTMMPTQANNVFAAKAGISTVQYNAKLYTLTDGKFYTSDTWATSWKVAHSKQQPDARIPKTTEQSVVVDGENNIWIFGGVSGSPMQVWKGRLNSLNPKK